jgi:putative ABC transport system permease protein
MQAADLVLSDTNPIDPQWLNKAEQLKLKQSHVTMFSSMASTRDQFVMVNVKAIDPSFPLRGELRIRPQQSLQNGGIWLSKRAQELLKLNIGDQVQIANGQFKVTGIIEHDSNQELGFSAFSPTVIIAQADVAKTGAIQIGSRIEYRLLMAGENSRLKLIKPSLKHSKRKKRKILPSNLHRISRKILRLQKQGSQRLKRNSFIPNLNHLLKTCKQRIKL